MPISFNSNSVYIQTSQVTGDFKAYSADVLGPATTTVLTVAAGKKFIIKQIILSCSGTNANGKIFLNQGAGDAEIAFAKMTTSATATEQNLYIDGIVLEAGDTVKVNCTAAGGVAFGCVNGYEITL
jgi:hypothetical protein